MRLTVLVVYRRIAKRRMAEHLARHGLRAHKRKAQMLARSQLKAIARELLVSTRKPVCCHEHVFSCGNVHAERKLRHLELHISAVRQTCKRPALTLCQSGAGERKRPRRDGVNALPAAAVEKLCRACDRAEPCGRAAEPCLGHGGRLGRERGKSGCVPFADWLQADVRAEHIAHEALLVHTALVRHGARHVVGERFGRGVEHVFFTQIFKEPERIRQLRFALGAQEAADLIDIAARRAKMRKPALRAGMGGSRKAAAFAAAALAEACFALSGAGREEGVLCGARKIPSV